MTLTTEQLDKLRDLEARATPGPWFHKDNDLIGGKCIMPIDATPGEANRSEVADFLFTGDGEFMVELRNAAAQVLDELLLLRARQQDVLETLATLAKSNRGWGHVRSAADLQLIHDAYAKAWAG